MNRFWTAATELRNPSELAGLSFHLDARNSASMTLDGSQRLSAWNSVSPAVSFIQADSSRQPLYVSNGIQGLPSLQWDTTDFLTATVSGMNSATAFSFFVVARPSLAGQSDVQSLGALMRISNSWSAGGLTGNFAGETFAFAATGPGGIQPRLGAPEAQFDWAAQEALVCGFRVGPSGSVLLNNHQAATLSLTSGGMTPGGNFAPSQMTVATAVTDLMLQYDGLVGEIVGYMRELSLQEMQRLVRYLLRRWRIK